MGFLEFYYLTKSPVSEEIAAFLSKKFPKGIDLVPVKSGTKLPPKITKLPYLSVTDSKGVTKIATGTENCTNFVKRYFITPTQGAPQGASQGAPQGASRGHAPQGASRGYPQGAPQQGAPQQGAPQGAPQGDLDSYVLNPLDFSTIDLSASSRDGIDGTIIGDTKFDFSLSEGIKNTDLPPQPIKERPGNFSRNLKYQRPKIDDRNPQATNAYISFQGFNSSNQPNMMPPRHDRPTFLPQGAQSSAEHGRQLQQEYTRSNENAQSIEAMFSEYRGQYQEQKRF